MSLSPGVVGIGTSLISSLLGGKTRVQFIQGSSTVIQLDASMKEKHSRKSEATKVPVENGQTISDHIIVGPFDLVITGVISDTPIGGLQGLLQEAGVTAASALLPPVGLQVAGAALAIFGALAGSKKPSVAAYGQLLQLQASAMPVDVITSLYRYPSMWITDISVPREASNGNVLEFDVTLAQLLLVQPQSVNISIFANPGLASPKADLGQQGTQLTSAFSQGQSALNNLAGVRP